jgi:hypothetical protein
LCGVLPGELFAETTRRARDENPRLIVRCRRKSWTPAWRLLKPDAGRCCARRGRCQRFERTPRRCADSERVCGCTCPRAWRQSIIDTVSELRQIPPEPSIAPFAPISVERTATQRLRPLDWLGDVVTLLRGLWQPGGERRTCIG